MSNYARVKDIIEFLFDYNQSMFSVTPMYQSKLIDAKLWDFYTEYHSDVDRILLKKFSNFVIPGVDKPSETTGTQEEKYAILRSQLTDCEGAFFTGCANSINRLWEAESLKFSPIENYDSYTENKIVKTGSEIDKVTEAGKEINQNKLDGQNIKQNVRSGSVKNANSGTVSDVTDNSSTSYNTNQIDTVTKNITDGTATTTEYNNITDVETETPGVTTTDTKSFQDRDTTRTTEYNQVTDTFTEHKHGNIGVSTSTSIFREFADFYTVYHFWERFWQMWIMINASSIFETDKSYYIND